MLLILEDSNKVDFSRTPTTSPLEAARIEAGI